MAVDSLSRYCKTASPSVTVTGTKLKVGGKCQEEIFSTGSSRSRPPSCSTVTYCHSQVLFKSHKKSRGGVGASCTASCTSAAPPATTEAPGDRTGQN